VQRTCLVALDVERGRRTGAGNRAHFAAGEERSKSAGGRFAGAKDANYAARGLAVRLLKDTARCQMFRLLFTLQKKKEVKKNEKRKNIGF